MDRHRLERDLVKYVREYLDLAVLSAADDAALIVERFYKAQLSELLAPHVMYMLMRFLLRIRYNSSNFTDNISLFLLLRGVALLILILDDFSSCS